jgi:hypothetical protein
MHPPQGPHTLFTREIDILREAMLREGDQLLTDPPGDASCRFAGTIMIELDVLSPTSDLSRYGRRLFRDGRR